MTARHGETINGLALCSGIAGIDLGLSIALGGDYRTVCHVERDAFAAAVLVARMEDKALDAAPVWDDLKTFDGRSWRGVVDIVTAGYPCQPFSLAGKRLGVRDERHLWPDVLRIIGEVQPGCVFLENVAAHLGMGYAEVERDLQGLGYRVRPGLFTAEEVGAPHGSKRLFILAYRDGGCGDADGAGGHCVAPGERSVADAGSAGREEWGCECGDDGKECAAVERGGGALADSGGGGRWAQGDVGECAERVVGPGVDVADAECGGHDGRAYDAGRCAEGGVVVEGAGAGVRGAVADAYGVDDAEPEAGGGGSAGGVVAGAGGELADAEGRGKEWAKRERSAAWPSAGRDGSEFGDADGDGRSEAFCGEAEGLGPFPPGPGALGEWAAVLARHPGLAPAIAEAEAESGVCGVVDGFSARVDRLRCLGNAVVPDVAAVAFVRLAAELGIGLGEQPAEIVA